VIDTIDEFVGIAKQKTGELTGNTQLQTEGTFQKVTGKAKDVWDHAKDAVRQADEVAPAARTSCLAGGGMCSNARAL
jgi:uncharacterized protein YjbJ (UPF0337 family)